MEPTTASPDPPDGDVSARSPFNRVRAWVVLVIVLGAGVAVEVTRRAVAPGMPEDTSDAVSSLAFQLTVAGMLVLYLRGRGVSLRRLVGRVPRGWRPWALAAMGVPLLVLSLGTAALQFSVLTALAPKAAASMQATADAASGVPSTAIVLAQALAGVLAAAMEELLFRGVLLARWERRWGPVRAAVASSLCFAVLHLDLLGAFTFGMVMCVLYLRTRSLLVPILCHSLNNAVVALSDLGGASGNVAGPSAADLAPDWGAAAIAIGVSIPVLWWFFRTVRPADGWRLPYYDPD
jgi:membrane protease YdiL (CAAX protease family)